MIFVTQIIIAHKSLRPKGLLDSSSSALGFVELVCLIFTLDERTFSSQYAVKICFTSLISGSKVASSCPRRERLPRKTTPR